MALFETLGVFSRKDRLHQAILSYLPAQEREQHTLPFDERSPFAMRRQYDAVIDELKETPREYGKYTITHDFLNTDHIRRTLGWGDYRVLPRVSKTLIKRYFNTRPIYFKKLHPPKQCREIRSTSFLGMSGEGYEAHGIFDNRFGDEKDKPIFIYRMDIKSCVDFKKAGCFVFKDGIFPGDAGWPENTKHHYAYCDAEVKRVRRSMKRYLTQNGFNVSKITDIRTLVRMLMSF